MNDCTCQSLLLVALQIALAACVIIRPKQQTTHLKDDESVVKVQRLIARVLSGVFLMFVGIFIVYSYPVCGWLSFTIGAMLLLDTYNYNGRKQATNTITRALIVSTFLLLVCFAAAPMFGNFIGWSPFLFMATLGLLFIMILELVWPSQDKKTLNLLSCCGAVIFALWTIRDIKDISCITPFEKSIRVFLDLLNLFNFSSMGIQ